ncbi:hypothetical protein, partial [Gordonia sp. i37]|uniref:hypothetical protein n=1 Tax=Gordonia sp. i37 TaxID=1961707 RepID=UPI001C0DB633
CHSDRAFRLPLTARTDTNRWIEVKVSTMQHHGEDEIIAAHPQFGGRLGLAVADRLGYRSPPAEKVHQLSSNDEINCHSWLLAKSQIAAFSALPSTATDPVCSREPSSTEREYWEATEFQLVRVSDGHDPDPSRLIVFGDSAEDYCLAMIWNRLYGNATWIATEWLDSPHRTLILGTLRDDLGLDHPDTSKRWIATSASLRPDDIATVRDDLVSSDGRFLYSPTPQVSSAMVAVDGRDVDLQFPHAAKWHLGISDQFTSGSAYPFFISATGSATMAVPVTTPLVADPHLRDTTGMSWQVDVLFADEAMPPARPLLQKSLLHPDESPLSTWVRSSRNGISFESSSYGFVHAGALPEDRLARPRLRSLSLFDWAAARSEALDYRIQVSPAGRRARLLSELMESRSRLIDVVCGDLHAMYGYLLPDGAKSTPERYGTIEGCLVGRRVGYLTFRGILQVTGLDEGVAREQLDELLVRGLVRRGLILRCAVCEDLAFHAVDDLGQSNRCTRCAAHSQLTGQRWRSPKGEPHWYYGLHAVAFDLIADNGDVPLLLSKYLRGRALRPQRYADCDEFEVISEAGSKVAEADLLATIDGNLVVAEAKRTSKLDGSRSALNSTARKRAELARLYECDELALATTEHSWTSASVKAVVHALRHATWTRYPAPRLRLITNLSAAMSNVGDDYIRID